MVNRTQDLNIRLTESEKAIIQKLSTNPRDLSEKIRKILLSKAGADPLQLKLQTLIEETNEISTKVAALETRQEIVNGLIINLEKQIEAKQKVEE